MDSKLRTHKIEWSNGHYALMLGFAFYRADGEGSSEAKLTQVHFCVLFEKYLEPI